MISWSSSSQRLAQYSWFTVKMQGATSTTSQGTSLPSPRSLLPRITDAVLQRIASDEEKKSRAALAAKEKRDEAKRLRMMEGAKEAPAKKKSYEHPFRARRIRIYPDKEQKEKITKWMGAVRFQARVVADGGRDQEQGEGNPSQDGVVAVRELPGDFNPQV